MSRPGTSLGMAGGKRRAEKRKRIKELESENQDVKEALGTLRDVAKQVLESNEPIPPHLWQRLSKAISESEEILEDADS